MQEYEETFDVGGAPVHGLNRRDLLKLLGAAGVTVAAGPALMSGSAIAQTTPEVPDLDPTDLEFVTKGQFRPFDIVADGFVELTEEFDGPLFGYTRLAPAPELNRGRIRSRDGRLSVSGEEFSTLFRSILSPVAPYAAIQVGVQSMSSEPDLAQNTVSAGLVRSAGNHVVASYNHATGTVAIDVVLRRRRNRINQRTDIELQAPFTFAVVVTSNFVTALVDRQDGQGYIPLLRANVAVEIDLRDPEVLARYFYGWGVRAEAGEIAIDRVEAGYWGKAGVRDPHVVTFADGTPYIVDNKVFLTLTNAGLEFFPTAHFGVYTLDLANPFEAAGLQEVGKIFFERRGNLVGDHAGHLIYDEAIGGFHVLASTWGDFSGNGVRITYAQVEGVELLTSVTVIRDPEILDLPTEFSRWDPHAVKIEGRWHVAYVESPTQTPFTFYPALARSRGGTRIGRLEFVGRDDTLGGEGNRGIRETEGMVMQKFGGQWYVLASTSSIQAEDPDRYRIYDLNMEFVGYLNAEHPTNIPHPMVFPIAVPDAETGSTRWLLVTFNGTQYDEIVAKTGDEDAFGLGYGTHGDFYVQEATELVPGFEFPPREAPAPAGLAR